MKKYQFLALLLMIAMAVAGCFAQTPSSSSLTQVVNQASIGSGQFTITSSLNPSAYNQPVTFTAQLPTDATGTVTFYDSSTSIGSSPVSSGTATVTTAVLASGSHSITAQYSGDGNYLPATSPALTQTVNLADSMTQLFLSQSNTTMGTPVTLTALVSTGSGVTTASQISFSDGATIIGTGSISVVNTTNLALHSENLSGCRVDCQPGHRRWRSTRADA